MEWLLKIGGITVETGRALGRDLSLDLLRDEFDAVFLGIGLAGVNALTPRARGAPTSMTRWSSSPPCASRPTSRCCRSGGTWW